MLLFSTNFFLIRCTKPTFDAIYSICSQAYIKINTMRNMFTIEVDLKTSKNTFFNVEIKLIKVLKIKIMLL